MLVGLIINLLALRLYKVQGGQDRSRACLPGWLDKWNFSPQLLDGFFYRHLFLVNVLVLFLELLMIRWVSSELSVFAYFKNFVLIACFLGFGTGCYLANRRINLLAMLVLLVALAVICELPSPAFCSTARASPPVRS